VNKTLLAIGGGILIAGGLAYWYLQQNGNGVKKCSDFITQSDCEANNCYWCNGQCQSTPCNGTDCNPLYLGECHSGIEGWQKCDPLSKALCKCQNGEWICIEQSSPICINNISHKECGVNLNGDIICGEYAGDGVDQCGVVGQGCSCDTGNCHPATYCCSDQICREKAQNLTISADDSNWTCSPIAGGGNECVYELGKSYAATSLIGTLYWKWGFPLAGMTWAVRALYNGVWTVLADGALVQGGTEGQINISTQFLAQGITALRFETYAPNNTKPNYFIGHISY